MTITQDFYLSKYPVTVGEFRKFIDSTQYRTTADLLGAAVCVSTKDNLELRGIPGENWANPDFATQDDHPVTCVSYYDAVRYIDWLNTQKSELIPDGWKFSLPTDAQWEYACKAGHDRDYPWESDLPEDGAGWLNGHDETFQGLINETSASDSVESTIFPFNDEYAFTSPVGKFKPNAWGLYDMLGNVGEWRQDWYDKDFYSISGGE